VTFPRRKTRTAHNERESEKNEEYTNDELGDKQTGGGGGAEWMGPPKRASQLGAKV
jgi:hypothetical protein